MLNPPLSLHDSCGVWSVVPLSANRGPAGARNAGIAAATGEWIAFLDADDAWLPDKMELQMAFLDAHPESVMICGDYIDFADNVTTEDGREAGLRRVPDIKHVHIITLEELACQNPVATSTVVVKKAVLEAVGGFDEQFRGPEDYDLWIRIAALTGSRLISCQGVKLLSESPEVSPSTTTQQPNNLTTAASGTANIMHIALPVSLYRQQTGSLSMDDRKFLPQVLRVVDKAWGKGGALHGMGGQRQARGYHYLACAWMAAERGALGWAVRLWFLAVWYWPFPVRGWRRHIPWAHAKVAWRILSQLKRRFFMGNGPVLKGAVQ